MLLVEEQHGQVGNVQIVVIYSKYIIILILMIKSLSTVVLTV